ncbi:MAG: ArsA family ATPase, partial [Thermoleophilaceae bacterium]|nr:ArsA family ATPase [Thermoleophilaceae bacterium]
MQPSAPPRLLRHRPQLRRVHHRARGFDPAGPRYRDPREACWRSLLRVQAFRRANHDPSRGESGARPRSHLPSWHWLICLHPARERHLQRSPRRQGAAHGQRTAHVRHRHDRGRDALSTPPRTILYTGKGGVGKTSVAAATARRCAAAGLRTIVLSTDPAHSLSDSLEVDLGNAPTEVGPLLHGQEVQAQQEMESNWEAVSGWLGDLLAERGVDPISAEELTVPPGMDEL